MSTRSLKLGDIDIQTLLKDYRKAVRGKKESFRTDCMKNGEPPLEFVTKFCYYWLQYIESSTGLKLLTEKDHKEIKNDKN